MDLLEVTVTVTLESVTRPLVLSICLISLPRSNVAGSNFRFFGSILQPSLYPLI